MSHFRYNRKSVLALMEKYSLLKAKTDTAREFYNHIPVSGRQERISAFKKWLKLFCETNEYMIEIIGYYSPRTAKNLKTQLKGYARLQRSYLTEKYLNSMASWTNEMIDRTLKTALDDAMQFGRLEETRILLSFNSIMDTLLSVRGGLPSGTEDKVVQNLSRYKPELVKIYKGAIESLESKNPDRYRHCSASMRQLVDKAFGENSVERRKILKEHTRSEKEMQILEALANLVKSIDEMWNKGVHSEIKLETALLALQATELLILQVYSSKKKK